LHLIRDRGGCDTRRSGFRFRFTGGLQTSIAIGDRFVSTLAFVAMATRSLLSNRGVAARLLSGNIRAIASAMF